MVLSGTAIVKPSVTGRRPESQSAGFDLQLTRRRQFAFDVKGYDSLVVGRARRVLERQIRLLRHGRLGLFRLGGADIILVPLAAFAIISGANSNGGHWVGLQIGSNTKLGGHHLAHPGDAA